MFQCGLLGIEGLGYGFGIQVRHAEMIGAQISGWLTADGV